MNINESFDIFLTPRDIVKPGRGAYVSVLENWYYKSLNRPSVFIPNFADW
jgi:hypothetical protein